jgi:TRAP-type C4-dicarboxylate transport system permease small subunit
MDEFKMSLFQVLLAIDLCILLIAMILFVIFGQTTVRKLRKNPETKNALGVEFVSGWDILNTANALALPKKFARRIKKAPFGMLHADADLLYKHTSRFDRILAKIFYVPWMLFGLLMIFLILLDLFGFCKQ